MKKICPTCNKTFEAIRSKKTCSLECKRDKFIKVYLTRKEFESVQNFKERLLIQTPTMSLQDLLRLMLKNIDIAMIEYMKLDADDPVKILMYNKALIQKFA